MYVSYDLVRNKDICDVLQEKGATYLRKLAGVLTTLPQVPTPNVTKFPQVPANIPTTFPQVPDAFLRKVSVLTFLWNVTYYTYDHIPVSTTLIFKVASSYKLKTKLTFVTTPFPSFSRSK